MPVPLGVSRITHSVRREKQPAAGKSWRTAPADTTTDFLVDRPVLGHDLEVATPRERPGFLGPRHDLKTGGSVKGPECIRINPRTGIIRWSRSATAERRD